MSHRNGDSRVCGGKTVVVGQDFVYVDGKLWSVRADPDDHGEGALHNSQDFVSINGKRVILVGDHADADLLCLPFGPPHCDPISASGSPLCIVN